MPEVPSNPLHPPVYNDYQRPHSLHSGTEVCRRWHPKITGARLFIVVSAIALGTAKAVLTAQSSIVAPIAIEWVTGVAVFLMLETKREPHPTWLFKYDLMGYQLDERDMNLLDRPRQAHMTGHRLIVTLCIVGFGTAKAATAFLGYGTEPTVLEWVLGVLITVSLYLLGLYEESPSMVMPWLFEKNYSEDTKFGAGLFYFVGMAAAVVYGVVFPSAEFISTVYHRDGITMVAPMLWAISGAGSIALLALIYFASWLPRTSHNRISSFHDWPPTRLPSAITCVEVVYVPWYVRDTMGWYWALLLGLACIGGGASFQYYHLMGLKYAAFDKDFRIYVQGCLSLDGAR
ncbi:hypothetical protein FA15DRAFT_659605 [Coprinopsis marcescibilis]|uniref:Uncharacterized protein n=1 Tax=Coprinopsis marcescibilis TaxID=230819 RepID=A0A5C3KHY8_COPMA|nr:hypothetical protein FA15DRAFT_659605 [Coprinopsis marcescibilis]